MNKKNKNRLRTERFELRMTKLEREYLKDKSEYLGITESECLLRCLMDSVIIKYDTVGVKAVCDEINKIGVNINQIAKHVNQCGEYEKCDFEQLKNEYENLFNMVMDKIIDV